MCMRGGILGGQCKRRTEQRTENALRIHKTLMNTIGPPIRAFRTFEVWDTNRLFCIENMANMPRPVWGGLAGKALVYLVWTDPRKKMPFNYNPFYSVLLFSVIIDLSGH